MTVAILIPLMRPHKIGPLIENIAATTTDYRIIVIANGACADAVRELPVTLLEDEGGSWPERINRGYKITTEAEPYFFTAADDLWFRDHWFEEAMKVMADVDGVVAVNDLHNPNGVHFLISRHYIETKGGVIDEMPGMVACEKYRHAYVDDELRATAKMRKRWGYAEDYIVEHMHVGAMKAPDDDIYQVGLQSMSQGLGVFQSRSKLWTVA
jgi:hypothetical protein